MTPGVGVASHPAVVAGLPCRRVDDDGRSTPLPVRRWHAPAERALRRLADRCGGTVLDVGCGPGRLAVELTDRGVRALGIDDCPAAVRLARTRGAVAVRRHVFDPLPDEGRWRHVVLADGNLGIGGDPVALLRRCAALVRPDGTVLVEIDPAGSGRWQGLARLYHPLGESVPYRWARVGVDRLGEVVAATPLTVRRICGYDGRWFAELGRP